MARIARGKFISPFKSLCNVTIKFLHPFLIWSRNSSLRSSTKRFFFFEIFKTRQHKHIPNDRGENVKFVYIYLTGYFSGNWQSFILGKSEARRSRREGVGTGLALSLSLVSSQAPLVHTALLRSNACRTRSMRKDRLPLVEIFFLTIMEHGKHLPFSKQITYSI